MSRTTLFRLLAAAALLVAPGAARVSAQAPDRTARARADLPRAAAARFDQIVADARAQGLPTDPLVDKALEGEAKHVPPDRIIAVLTQLSQNLGRARALIAQGGAPSGDDVAAAADALRRGVPERAVRELRARQANRPVAMAVVTLADLVQQGVPVEQALNLLQAWSDRHGSNAELRDLPAAVERLMHQGVLPAQAAQAVAQSVRNAGTGRPASPGKSDLAPGQAGKVVRPPVAPGAGPPPGKGRPPRGRPDGV